MSNQPRWEIIRTTKGHHLRFRAANAELVQDGQVLGTEADAITAMLSIARAHSPVGRAEYHRELGQVWVYTTHGHTHHPVQVVVRDDRRRGLAGKARYIARLGRLGRL